MPPVLAAGAPVAGSGEMRERSNEMNVMDDDNNEEEENES